MYPTNIPSYPSTAGGEYLGEAGNGKGLPQILNDYGSDITELCTKIGPNIEGQGATVPDDNHILVGTADGNSIWLPYVTNLGLYSPYIDEFSNSNHNHEDLAGGGTLGTDAIDDNAITTAKIADNNVTSVKKTESVNGTERRILWKIGTFTITINGETDYSTDTGIAKFPTSLIGGAIKREWISTNWNYVMRGHEFAQGASNIVFNHHSYSSVSQQLSIDWIAWGY